MSTGSNRHIVLAITGGIAAYKSLFLIRLFKKAGYDVKVVVTRNALEFVTPLTLETLSQNKLYYDTFQSYGEWDVHHISLSEWADAMVVAPATANIIGKFSHGIADDALSTLLLAMKKPLFFAPAMNTNMYTHAVVQENMKILKQQGVRFIESAEGYLACGTEGLGRMEEPEVIFRTVDTFFHSKPLFHGKKILVTAGPTYEPIDPVRFLGNHSSGRMGFALAEVFAECGGEVILITGPSNMQSVHSSIQRIDVVTASEMYEQTLRWAPPSDIIIMSAAVADYTPAKPAAEKIKKTDSSFSLELVKTRDILAELGRLKKETQYLVGFALETENEISHAKSKLQNKNLDLIVLNSLKTAGAGFKTSTNRVLLIARNGQTVEGVLKDKKEVAADIADFIYREINSGKHNT